MNPDDDTTTRLVVTLNRLTSQDKIKWTQQRPAPIVLRGTDDTIPSYLATHYKGNRFALFQQRYQNYDGEHDRFYWSDRVVLAILDAFEQAIIWETSTPHAALYDLFETARHKVADIEGVLKDLLADGEEEEEDEDGL